MITITATETNEQRIKRYFPRPLKVQPEQSERNKVWFLLDEVVFNPEGESSAWTIRVPMGFKTDFASIPRFFWRILPPWDSHMPAAVVHDYLYKTGHRSRKEADQLFLLGMEVLGTKKWKRRAMYRAVRMFGWRFYQGGN